MNQKAPRRWGPGHIRAVFFRRQRDVKSPRHVDEVDVVGPRLIASSRHLMNHSKLPAVARRAHEDVRPFHLRGQQLRTSLPCRQQCIITWWHVKGISGASFRAVRGELVIVAMQSVVCTDLLHRTTRPILLHKVTVLRDVYFGLPRRFAVAAPVCFELRETGAARPSVTPLIMVTESCQKRKFILETFCRKLS